MLLFGYRLGNIKGYNLYLFVVLMSVAFFNPFGFISNKRLPIHLFEIGIVISAIYALKINRFRLKWNHTYWLYLLFIISMFISMLMAELYHRQPLLVSLFSTFPLLGAYLYFPILLKFNIPKDIIINTIKILLIISTVVYLCNLLLPVRIFEWGRFEELSGRGIRRVWIPFIELHVLSLFYHINLYIIKGNDTSYVKWIVFEMIIILLSVTRQYILCATILGAWLLLKNVSLLKKIGYISLFSILLYSALQTSLANKLIDLTNQQVSTQSDVEDNVRMRAFYFFTEDCQVNEYTKVFGNGVLSTNSKWGEDLNDTMSLLGFYFVDIGWTGIFYYFGWLGVLSLLAFFLCTIVKKKNPENQYLTYFICFIVITSTLSGMVVYHNQILSISTALYLIYKRPSKREFIRIK